MASAKDAYFKIMLLKYETFINRGSRLYRILLVTLFELLVSAIVATSLLITLNSMYITSFISTYACSILLQGRYKEVYEEGYTSSNKIDVNELEWIEFKYN